MKKTVLSILSQMRGRYRLPSLAFLLLFGCASLTFFWHGYTANPVHLLFIQDEAHVLDQEQVIQAASGVGYNIDLFTLDGNAGDLSAFPSTHAPTSPDGTVVIIIDTLHKRLALQGNGNVPNNPVSFTASQYLAARKAFQTNMGKDDFTTATVALLQSLSNASASNQFLPHLTWLGGFLTDFVLTGFLVGVLLFPKKGKRETADPPRDLSTRPLA